MQLQVIMLVSGVSVRRMRDVRSHDSGPSQTQTVELELYKRT